MTVIFSDTFTDTDSVTLLNHTPDVDVAGTGWVEGKIATADPACDADIASNQARFVTNFTSCVHDGGAANCDISFDVVMAVGVQNQARAIFRRNGENNCIFATINENSDRIGVLKDVAGSFTQIANPSVTFDEGQTYNIRINLDGSAIKIYVDGSATPSVDITETDHQTATAHGIGRGDGNSATRIDNFEIETTTVNAEVALTGVSTTAGIGTLSVSGGATVPMSGVSAATQAGVLVVTGGAVVPLPGVQATSAIGAMIASGGAVLVLDGVSASGQPGSVTVLGNAIAELTGVQATGNIGDLTAIGGALAALVGVEASSVVGVLDITGGANVTLTGVQADGQVGDITIPSAAIVVPGYRIYTIEHQDRTYLIVAQDRTYTIH